MGNIEAVGSLAAVFGLVVAIIAVVASSLRIQEAVKSRHFEGTWKVLTELGTKDARTKRSYVIKRVRNLSRGELTEVHKCYNDAWEVWRILNDVGLMIHFGLIDDRPILEHYYGAIITLWDSSKKHVEHERKQRSNPRYLGYFENLAKLSWKWQKDRNLPEPTLY